MRILSGIVSATLLMPALALAEEAKEQQIHDKPAVRGSIIANLLQEHDNPFTLYPYDPNYLLYTDTSDINKEAIKTYNWADKARKDEVKYQLSTAFPLWRGIAGDSSVLGASYTQRPVAIVQPRRVFAVPRNQLRAAAVRGVGDRLPLCRLDAARC